MILSVLTGSALRSIALGAGTWLALKLLQARHPHLQMTIWTVVLGTSMMMPLLIPWMRLPIPARATAVRIVSWAGAASTRVTAGTGSNSAFAQSHPPESPPRPHSWDWSAPVLAIYSIVAAVMVVRLVRGTRLTLRIVRAARRVRDPCAVGIDLRISDILAVPVTFGSAILLPRSYVDWSESKFRAVLRHEGSHVAHLDFYVLWLAALYRAVFWFNPFAWWLRRHLAELAEMVSDDAVIADLHDRCAYAQILLEVAKLPERLPIGLAMARPGTVEQRVRRILSEAPVGASLTGRKRLLIILTLAPLASFSASTLEPTAVQDSAESMQATRAAHIDTVRAGELDRSLRRRVATAPERFRSQLPVAGGAAVLRKTINDVRYGAPDYAAMSQPLADKMRQQLPRWHAMMVALGEPVSIEFEAVGPGGYDLYAAKFAHGLAEFPLDLASDGRLEDMGFDPRGDGSPGAIAACALEPVLASHDAVPIRLSLINRSGSDLELFALNAAGSRVSLGTLAGDGRSRYLLTYVQHPLVIADESKQCREILLPGAKTRIHVIEPSGASTPVRSIQLAGSEQALRQYINGIERGAPPYEQVTPEAAVVLRDRWLRQKAILAKLGTLQTLTFRGVTETGSDLYSVQFVNGSTEWRIRLGNGRRIAEVALGPPSRH